MSSEQKMREALQAVRDHIKFEANSDGGLVARIDRVIAETDALSAPAREARTEHVWWHGELKLRVTWSITLRMWFIQEHDGDITWCDAGPDTDPYAAEIAKLKGLVPPGGEE